jgi:Ca2+-binding RTX toxin-like protein
MFFVSVMLCSFSAGATTTVFYGDDDANHITVGRGYDGGQLVYLACIQGPGWSSWDYGAAVTGTNDYVSVGGYGGFDYIEVRAVNDYFTCGAEMKWFYQMNYTYACPAANHIYFNGGTGYDVLVGGVCTEKLSGASDDDSLFGGAGNDLLIGGTGSDCLQDSDVSSADCGDDTDNERTPGDGVNCENHENMCFTLPPPN